jgi:hypothetical protein
MASAVQNNTSKQPQTQPPLSGGSLTHTHAHVLPKFRSMKYPDLVVCVEALGPALRGPQDEELLRFFTSPEAVAGAPELAPDPASGRPAVEALRIVRDPSTSLGRGYAFVLLRSKARLRLCTLLHLKWGNALGARRACLQFCSQFQSGNDLRASYFLGTLDSHALTTSLQTPLLGHHPLAASSATQLYHCAPIAHF